VLARIVTDAEFWIWAALALFGVYVAVMLALVAALFVKSFLF
jgi:hypothetical protein